MHAWERSLEGFPKAGPTRRKRRRHPPLHRLRRGFPARGGGALLEKWPLA